MKKIKPDEFASRLISALSVISSGEISSFSGNVGKSEIFLILRSFKKVFVVTSNAGLPGVSLYPEIFTQSLSSKFLIIFVLTWTPLISSISPLVTGCL